MEPDRSLTLVRQIHTPVRAEGASSAEGMPIMDVRFAPFDSWYEIDSWFEGRFLERVKRGAFKKTIRERGDQVKVLFNHGRDLMIGSKLLGTVDRLKEESDSPVGEVQLFDTTYNRDLLPGLLAGAYGSSFMFEALGHNWNEEPGASDYNPDGLPERTITEVRLYEFGPVTWPANPAATSGVRSGTDDWYEHLRTVSPEHVERISARIRDQRTAPIPGPHTGTQDDSTAAGNVTTEPDTHSVGLTARERRERIYSYLKEK